VNGDEPRRAEAAVAREAISTGEDAVVGVGTGSTANFFIDELARSRAVSGAVASSDRSAESSKARHPAVSTSKREQLPVYIDGADEIPSISR